MWALDAEHPEVKRVLNGLHQLGIKPVVTQLGQRREHVGSLSRPSLVNLLAPLANGLWRL